RPRCWLSRTLRETEPIQRGAAGENAGKLRLQTDRAASHHAKCGRAQMLDRPGAVVMGGRLDHSHAGLRAGPRGIRMNAVNPGMVATEGNASAAAECESRKIFEDLTPLGRIGQAGDITPAVVFLAVNDAKWVTGEIQCIAGGYP